MKKIVLCILALLFAFGMTAFAETTEIVQKEILPESTTTALSVNDFVTESEYPYETVGYFLDDVAFLGEDNMEVSITFTGNYGSNEYFFSNCYIPVYDYETGKLLDIFYSEVELQRPFATSSRTSIKRMISTKNIDADIYKIKVIMLESLTSLRPNCPVPYLANELVIAKENIAQPTPTDTPAPTTAPTPTVEPTPTANPLPTAVIRVKLSTVPITKDVTQIALPSYSWTNFDLSDIALAMGYNESNITLQTIIDCNGIDLKPYQGLTCDYEVDLSNLDHWKLLSVTPTAGKNAEIVVNPELLLETNYTDGYIEYKQTADDDGISIIRVNYSTPPLTYKNLVSGSFYLDVVPGGNVGDVAYRFVDTDGDAIYDTVFVDNVGVFVIGSVNEKSYKIYRDTTSPNAMTNYVNAYITLDPEDETVNWSLTDKEGNDIELDDIEVGSVAAVTYSTDGANVYYDIVISNDTIEGVVSEVYTEYGKTYYTIGDTDYTMLVNFGMAIMPGDTVTATVYGNIIVNFTVDTGVEYGVVIATNLITNYGTTYQLQILNQNGEVVTLNMAEIVNGAIYTGADFDWNSGYSDMDRIIAYKLNDAGEIMAYDVESGVYFNSSNVVGYDRLSSNLSGAYKESSSKLDSYYITDDTIIITTKNARGSNDKNDYELASTSVFDETEVYDYTVVYDENKNAKFVVLYQVMGRVNMDSYPLVVTKTSTVYVNNSYRTKYYGYINGEEVELIAADGVYLDMYTNDVAMIATNSAGEIVSCVILAKYNATGYTVLDNSQNAYDDSKTMYTATKCNINFAPTFNTPVTSTILSSFFTVSASTYDALKGFGAVGKAYDIKGKILNLVSPTGYACSIDGFGNRTYGVVDEFICDYAINPATVAYIYNVQTGKYKLGTIGDLETEINTNDCRDATQLDNDDAIYVYNYDGETKLILIVDVKGDN